MSALRRPLMVIVVFLGGGVPLAAQPTGGQPLLDFVRNAHNASRESIRTLSCSVEFSATITFPGGKPPKTKGNSGQYCFSPAAVRAKTNDASRESDSVWKDAVRKSVSSKPSPRPPPGSAGLALASAGLVRSASKHVGRCDPWTQGLLILNRPGTIHHVPFEDLLT